jgi:hypothetical protein
LKEGDSGGIAPPRVAGYSGLETLRRDSHSWSCQYPVSMAIGATGDRVEILRMRAASTIQDDPFIAPCCLLDSRVRYQRAEQRQGSFPIVELGLTCGCSGCGLSPQWPQPSGGRKQYTTKRGLTLVNAMQCTVLPHITASVFINDDADPEAGCTTAPAKLASCKPMS